MPLPDKYKWLENEGAPKMIVEFIKIYGVKEAQGNADNPVILEWAKEVGVKNYKKDATPWCGLEMAVIAFRAGKPVVKEPLWARNWLIWGTPVNVAKLGYVLVFERPGGFGHVGLYIAEDATHYHVGGGNEGDASNIVRMAKSRILGIRQPMYHTSEPVNVRQIFVDATGDISTNEA